MKNWVVLSVFVACLGVPAFAKPKDKLEYGQFSVSLQVKDIQKSFQFYDALGFRKVLGDLAHNWIILTNESAVIGLFQGEPDPNQLVFNPKDVRTLHRKLKSRGIKFDKDPENTTGPGYAKLTDPDGNKILLDQHQ